MIDYYVSNTIIDPENPEQIIAFFKFSSGEEFSNRFPLTSTVNEILAWGRGQADEMNARVQENEEKFLEIIDGISTAQDEVL